MMKTRISVTVVALSFAAAAFCFGAMKTADPAATPAAAKAAAPKKETAAMAASMSPQMGTWKLNEAKSKLVAGMGKSTTVVYSAQGDKVKVTVEGMDKDGKASHGTWVGKFDGMAYPTKGNLAWTSSAYKMVNDRTNNITTMKDGKVVWSGRIEVSKNGKSRTVTMNGTGADGKKFHGKAVYDKS